jgi:hypothetical protein
MVPPYVDNMIKDNSLFGYKPGNGQAKADKSKATA